MAPGGGGWRPVVKADRRAMAGDYMRHEARRETAPSIWPHLRFTCGRQEIYPTGRREQSDGREALLIQLLSALFCVGYPSALGTRPGTHQTYSPRPGRGAKQASKGLSRMGAVGHRMTGTWQCAHWHLPENKVVVSGEGKPIRRGKTLEFGVFRINGRCGKTHRHRPL